VPLTLFSDAEIVALPVPVAVASPAELIVAAAVFELTHETVEVTFAVELSE
jgi:hypothetical protein